jgi:hypothetical protein
MRHAKFTTAREAVEAHNGEALHQKQGFDAELPEPQNDRIEFRFQYSKLRDGRRQCSLYTACFAQFTPFTG